MKILICIRNTFVLRGTCGLLAMLLVMGLTAGALTGCGQEDSSDNTLTMYVGLGNTKTTYYRTLQAAVLEATGVELQLIYNNTNDTSNAILNRVEAYDLPADIVCTAARLPDEAVKNSFLDLAAWTNIPDLFTTSKRNSVSVDGSIYQLPFTTRLIGIEYNKTLFEEMGWQVPGNYEEMLELKAEAEAAGYKFAVSGGIVTGHGFNYLMNVMGTQYISSADGEKWLRDFQAGKDGADAFAYEADYFERYVEAGLFGSFHDGDWRASAEFSRERALLYYNTINDIYSYDGFRYNSDGTLYGAEYDGSGQVVAEEAADGEAVLIDGSYVLYDESNEAHRGLVRYHIPGAEVLHDEYAQMPWVSENGSCNCFVAYDNMYLALDKKLGEDGQETRLANAVKVLTYMASDEAADIFKDLYRDGYVGISDFTIDETRSYYAYKDEVERGYTMKWYYGEFDADSIVNVGEAVNSFIRGDEGSGLSEIINELVKYNSAYVDASDGGSIKVDRDFTYEESAGMQAVMAAAALQEAIDEAGGDAVVQVAVMPYADDISRLPDACNVAVVQERPHEGSFSYSMYRSIISGGTNNPVGIYMTGAEIRALTEGGYDIQENYGAEGTVFPYTYVTLEGLELQDDETYLVAIGSKCITNSLYEEYMEAGKVLMSGDAALTADSEPYFLNYIKTHDALSPEDFANLQ